MSARIEVPQTHRGFPGAGIIVPVVVAAVVGGLAGSAITQFLTDRTAPAPVSAGVSTTWDAGKLQAMAGRQLAAEVRTTVPLWDAGKLDAMSGRQLAALAGSTAPLWDTGKLEAMAGRQLAATPADRDASATRWNEAKLDAMQGSSPR